MTLTFYILSFLAVVGVITAVFYWYGEKLTRAKRDSDSALEKKFNELKDQYAKGLLLQQAEFDKKLSEIEGNFKNEVLKEIYKNDKQANNPFGSYLLPVLKVSSLYEVKDVLDRSYRAGKLTEQSYIVKSEWLEKEIIRKTGSEYYDDTNLNFDEA